MAGPLYVSPPRVGKTDENGNVVLTREEWDQLLRWLEEFTQFLAREYD